MNIDKKANEYWKSLTRPLASQQGLTETAYAVGALDQLNELKKEVDKGFSKFVGNRHPDPDSLLMQDNYGKDGKLRVGYESDQIDNLAEEYVLLKNEELQNAYNTLFNQCEQVIKEKNKIESAYAGYRIEHPNYSGSSFCESCGSNNCIC